MEDSHSKRMSAQLIEARSLSPSVRLLVFRCKNQSFSYQAGQWVNVFLNTHEGQDHRAYSIASAPAYRAAGEFEIAVTRVADGPVSSALHELPVGSEVELDGPWGFFTHDSLPSMPAVFVGTGTGLSPLRAMLQEDLTKSEGAQRVLLFGCRTQHDILWEEELSAWAQRSQRFRLEVTLSKPDAVWPGRTGYVQKHVVDLVRPLLPAHVYICGLSNMVKSVRTLLKEELHLQREFIHTERYD